jgi:excinuclease ABC subunit A
MSPVAAEDDAKARGFVQVENGVPRRRVRALRSLRGDPLQARGAEVRIRGHSIHDVLQWTVDDAINRLPAPAQLGAALWPTPAGGSGDTSGWASRRRTLSGGEAQRAEDRPGAAVGGKEGAGASCTCSMNPTTGLHLEDVRVLIQVLDRLVDAGHTVVVIEHHIDVIKRADWIIDMGPEGGPGGGQVVVQGPPENRRRRAALPHRSLPARRAGGGNCLHP